MKSCLIIFICVLVLMLNFQSTFENKSTKKSHGKNLSKSMKRPDPSGEPLPKFWTTGSRPNFPIQMNKKYKKYHSRLAASHKYKDHTKDLLKKNKKTGHKKSHSKKHNKKHAKKHHK